MRATGPPVDDGKGPLGRVCPEHRDTAVHHKMGINQGEWWAIWRYRCGCTTREGAAPAQPGDLISITAPDVGTTRGIVESDSGGTMRVRPVPFPELYEDD